MTSEFGVGTVVIATRDTGICRQGERGVCYEVYARGDGTNGHSILFERGGYDGFSPDEVALCLTVTDQVIPELQEYEFRNVGQLSSDHRRGVFKAAFKQPGAIC